MDMKVQGSRSGKALGIGELFASTCSASAPLDRSYISGILSWHTIVSRATPPKGVASETRHTKAPDERLEGAVKRTDHKIMPGTELAAANNKTRTRFSP